MAQSESTLTNARDRTKMECPVGEFAHRRFVQSEEEETPRDPDISPLLAIEIFQPAPNVLYSLDAAARILGITRRSILIYCRAGLVRPIIQQPYGVMVFTDGSIHTLRNIERLRTVPDIELSLIKTIFELRNQVEHLRAEMRFMHKN